MDVMSSSKFKAEVERYLACTGVSPSIFGTLYAGDPNFVLDLRNGREPREATRIRVLDRAGIDWESVS